MLCSFCMFAKQLSYPSKGRGGLRTRFSEQGSYKLQARLIPNIVPLTMGETLVNEDFVKDY